MFFLLWQRPPADHSVSLETWKYEKYLLCPVFNTYSINRLLNSFSAVPLFSGEDWLNFSRVSTPHAYKRQTIFIWIFFFLISTRQPFLLHLPSNYQSSCRTFLLQNIGWEPPPTLIPTRAVSHQPWGKIELLYRRGYYRIISSTSLHFNKYKCKSLSNKWKIIIYSKQKFKCIQV